MSYYRPLFSSAQTSNQLSALNEHFARLMPRSSVRYRVQEIVCPCCETYVPVAYEPNNTKHCGQFFRVNGRYAQTQEPPLERNQQVLWYSVPDRSWVK